MNDDKSKKKLEDRQSRFVWQANDVVIIKSTDEPKVKKGKPTSPAGPPSPDPAAPRPKKDNNQQDG